MKGRTKIEKDLEKEDGLLFKNTGVSWLNVVGEEANKRENVCRDIRVCRDTRGE